MKKIIPFLYLITFLTIGVMHPIYALIPGSDISTAAGSGSKGFFGDGDLATSAGFSFPISVAFDSEGNYYISDSENNVIRKVSTNGKISTVAGNGTSGSSGDGGLATNASLSRPGGVFADEFGNLYIADRFNHRIRKVNSDGIITTIAGTGSSGYSGDGGQAINAQLFRPNDVHVDRQNNIYIADTANHVIRKIAPDGIISTVAGRGGQFGYEGDTGQATLALLREPTSVFVDTFGSVLISDSSNHVIRKILPSGVIITVAGNSFSGYSGEGGPAVETTLNQPFDVISDNSGVLYIADTLNHRVRQVNSLGNILTVGGNGDPGFQGDNGLAINASFNEPIGLALDKAGNVYVADFQNQKIRKIGQPAPVAADANAGSAAINVAVPVGEPFQLKGAASGGDGSYIFNWQIASGPNTASGQISNINSISPVFTAILPGTYILRFTVDDEVHATATDTLIVIALNNNPSNTVFVSDTVNDLLDLSGFEDQDPQNQRDLVIRWNFDSSSVNTTIVENIFVFVETNGDGIYELLGKTGSGTATFLEWRLTNNSSIESKFQNGPQFGNSYRFRVFFITNVGNPPFFGPFTNSGPVKYSNEAGAITPTPVPPQSTATPTPIPPAATNTNTFTPTNTRTPTATRTATNTFTPTVSVPTNTFTQVVPIPPTNTSTPVQPTATFTSIPAPTATSPGQNPTNTPAVPTNTPAPGQPTATPIPGQPTATNTQVVPTNTPLPGAPTATFTSSVPNPNTPIAPSNTPTNTIPPTSTPTGPTATPTNTRTPTVPPTNTATATPTIPEGPATIRVEPSELTFQRGMILNSSPQAKMRAKAPIQQNDWTLYLKNDERIPAAQNDAAVKLSAVYQQPEKKHVLLQFYSLPDEAEKQRLAENGIELLTYIPNYAYWAAITPQQNNAATLQVSGSIRWMENAVNLDRLSSLVNENDFPTYAKKANGKAVVFVTLFQDENMDEVQSKIVNIGGIILDSPYQHIARVEMPLANAPLLSKIDAVEWVEPNKPEYQSNNLTSQQRIHVDVLKEAPFELTGKGMNVGVWDAGSVYRHSDFGSRLFNKESSPRAVNDNHATHVAGTIAGSGAGFNQAEGMAHAATIHSYDWNNDSNEMITAYNEGIRLSNHSYGLVLDTAPQLYGAYNSYSIPWDDVVYDTGLIVFKAAGNDGNFRSFDTIGPMGVAKNVITIAATKDDDSIASFSSKGPADDGRVKPDLAANGVSLLSTLPGNQYGQYSGTSMATPSACGAAALLFQYFLEQTELEPSAQLMKALLIHAARDFGNPGPDYTYGWGLIDVEATAALIENTLYRNGSISADTFIPYTVVVGANEPELKASLVWVDVPGSAASARALVNNLDLVVKSPSGQTFSPWVLSVNNPNNSATRGANNVDNVEQVAVSNPEAGSWTIEVHGTTVPNGPVEYALISEGFQASDSAGTLDIFNDGTGGLSVSSMNVTNGAWISVSPDDPVVVAPNQNKKVSVSVNFDRAPAGNSSRDIVISSNDINNPTVTVRVNIIENVLPTATSTNTATFTPTSTNTPSNTPTFTNTNTPTPTRTPTPTFTITNTPTATFTPIPLPNPTSTPTIDPNQPTATPTVDGSTPTATNTPAATNTPEPGQPTSTPTATQPTATPTSTPSSTRTPTVTPTPVSQIQYPFDNENETVFDLGFSVNPIDTEINFDDTLPEDEEQPQATNGKGINVTVPPGVFVTLSAPAIEVSSNPIAVHAWFNPSSSDVQVALGGFVEIKDIGGSNLFSLKGAPEFIPNSWHQAKVTASGQVTRIIPFFILVNSGSSSANVQIDNLVIDLRPSFSPRNAVSVVWIPNLFAGDNAGIALSQGGTLRLNKNVNQPLSHIVAPFEQSIFPNQTAIEMEVEKELGSTGTLSIVLTNGASSTQMNIPLFILPQGETHRIQLAGLNTTENIGLMHAVVQIAGDDEERVIIRNVKVYDDSAN